MSVLSVAPGAIYAPWREAVLGLPLVRSVRARQLAYRKRRFFERVVDLVETQNLPCLLVGGYGLDVRRGRLSRVHKDVDLSLREENRDVVVEAFARAGFVIREDRGCKLAAVDGPWHVDFFLWRDLGNGQAEHVGPPVSRRVIRCPVELLSLSRIGSLGKRRVRIASDDYLLCIRPLVRNEIDREYIAALEPSSPLCCRVESAVSPSGYELFSWRYGREVTLPMRTRRRGDFLNQKA